MFLRIFLAFVLGFGVAGATYYFLMPVSDSTVREQIEKWYKKQETGYTLELTATAVLDSNKNAINFEHQNMKVALQFAKPIDSITWQKDSLQAYFTDIVIDNIYHRIPSDGWQLVLNRSTQKDENAFICSAVGENEFSFELSSKIIAIKAKSTASDCEAIDEANTNKKCELLIEKTIPFRLVAKIIRPK